MKMKLKRILSIVLVLCVLICNLFINSFAVDINENPVGDNLISCLYLFFKSSCGFDTLQNGNLKATDEGLEFVQWLKDGKFYDFFYANDKYAIYSNTRAFEQSKLANDILQYSLIVTKDSYSVSNTGEVILKVPHQYGFALQFMAEIFMRTTGRWGNYNTADFSNADFTVKSFDSNNDRVFPVFCHYPAKIININLARKCFGFNDEFIYFDSNGIKYKLGGWNVTYDTHTSIDDKNVSTYFKFISNINFHRYKFINNSWSDLGVFYSCSKNFDSPVIRLNDLGEFSCFDSWCFLSTTEQIDYFRFSFLFNSNRHWIELHSLGDQILLSDGSSNVLANSNNNFSTPSLPLNDNFIDNGVIDKNWNNQLVDKSTIKNSATTVQKFDHLTTDENVYSPLANGDWWKKQGLYDKKNKCYDIRFFVTSVGSSGELYLDNAYYDKVVQHYVAYRPEEYNNPNQLTEEIQLQNNLDEFKLQTNSMVKFINGFSKTFKFINLRINDTFQFPFISGLVLFSLTFGLVIFIIGRRG